MFRHQRPAFSRGGRRDGFKRKHTRALVVVCRIRKHDVRGSRLVFTQVN